MDFSNIPFEQNAIKAAVGNGVLEFYYFSPNGRTGIKNLEMKIYYPDGLRKIIVLHDSGFKITSEEIKNHDFVGRQGRNEEIWRLYSENNLSQTFLANLFGISQPSVSLIVKKYKEEAKLPAKK